MQKFQLKQIAMTLSLSLAITAHAAGLGTMTSNSKLGEPLSAEIELLSVTPSELSSLQAALASDQVYQDQMLEKPASYPFIKIEIANNPKGQPVLKLSSTQPITEAFLDMLIQVDWPTGRLVKEYTLLLDPPGFNSNYVSDASSQPIVNESMVTPRKEPTVNLGDTRPATRIEDIVAPEKQAIVESASPTTARSQPQEINTAPLNSIKTERGDTLYAIARQMKPDHVTTEQMLMALYETNRDAFAGNNINRLQVGKILKLPKDTSVSALSASLASQQVKQHHADWLAYKQTLAGVVKDSAARDTGRTTQHSAGKIASAQSKPVPNQSAEKDVLKLAAGDEKSGKTAGKANEIAAKDEATAKANAVKEEQARAAALEKQVADMKKLMEMKKAAISQDGLAQAEKNAADSNKAAAAAPVVTPPPAPAVTPPAAPVAPTQAAQAPAQPSSAPPPAPAVAQAEVPTEPAPSFIQALLTRLKQMNPLLPIALVALPVLLGIWVIIRVRRKKQIDTFEDVIVTAPATELQNNTVFGDTQAAGSSDTSFLTDFSQSGVGGMIDAHDVDPIAEAEVYMAYGRDAQAEEILKDAIQKDPQRQELKVKLLEIYQGAGNKAAFETLATELYAATGSNDPLWAKASALGKKLDPDNGLYQMAASDAAASSPAVAAEVAVGQNIAPAQTAAAAVTSSEAEQGYHFNFEAPALEFESATQAVTAAPSEVSDSSEVSMLDTATPTPVTQQALAAKSSTVSEEALTIESSLDWQPTTTEAATVTPADFVEATPAAETTVALTPKALDLPSLNLEEAIPAEAALAEASLPPVGQPTLSDEDAVFEALPELSLELGSASAADSLSLDNDSLALDDFSIESALDTASNSDALLAEPTLVADNTPSALPTLSLDMAPSAAPAATDDVAVGLADEPEEVNTKLDLIQAYIDMEDLIGARELIEEVLAEGSASQQARASALLEKLA